jgi:hypothetical protein
LNQGVAFLAKTRRQVSAAASVLSFYMCVVSFHSGLLGRTILLILFWEAYTFSFPLVPSIAVPTPFLCLLATSALLVGMHHGFHSDIPFGRNGWYKLRASSRRVQVVYGPVVAIGSLFDKLLTACSLSVAIILVLPFLAPVLGYGLWRQHQALRKLRHKGRLLEWDQALQRLEQGKGILLLEYVDEEAGWWENLSRLWWIELAAPVEPGLPTYRQWLSRRISWETAHQSIQQAYQIYQHPEYGTGALVRIPWWSRKKIKQLLATQVPEASVRVTWMNT